MHGLLLALLPSHECIRAHGALFMAPGMVVDSPASTAAGADELNDQEKRRRLCVGSASVSHRATSAFVGRPRGPKFGTKTLIWSFFESLIE